MTLPVPPSTPSTPDPVRRSIEAVWRIESARLVAALARVTRSIDLAEELAHDALVAALEQWPAEGIPDKPAAWLMSVAKRRAIDAVRRRRGFDRVHETVARQTPTETDGAMADVDASLDDEIGDDLLRLIFTTCHPVLSTEARAALTLRLLGGLSTDEIARAFLVPEPTIAQRIVRAKKTLAEKQVAFEVPRGEALSERLASVLEVVYLLFNEGYTATSGPSWMRPTLCDEALRLGRILVGLAPLEPEAHGLLALIELQASRTRARLDHDGRPVLLLDQKRSLWDRLLLQRGLAGLARAEQLGGADGWYALQAAIAACHARATAAADTDWPRIVSLYDRLAGLSPSPVVQLNRAVAVSMAFGPERALEEVDRLAAEASLKQYHLLPSVRGDLLAKLGRHAEAAAACREAATLTQNQAERDLLSQRAEAYARQAATAH